LTIAASNIDRCGLGIGDVREGCGELCSVSGAVEGILFAFFFEMTIGYKPVSLSIGVGLAHVRVDADEGKWHWALFIR